MKYIFILISLLFTTVCDGQINIINQSLTDSSLNILYIGVDNRIKVAGYNDTYSLTITGAGGTFFKIEKNKYVVTVRSPTKLCEIMLLKGNKNVFKKTFRTEYIKSEPLATLAGFKDTAIKASRILLNPFISVIQPGCYYNNGNRVISFNAVFIQGADSTLTFTAGNQLSEEQIQLIKQLSFDDIIYFDDIRATCYSCRAFRLPSFWVKVE